MINLKRDLIYRIEELNIQYLIPQKYYTLVMALMIEDRPVTQDEIINLTGYGRSQVSQVLNQIFPMGLVEPVKIRGKRKKYFQTRCEFIDIYFKPILSTINAMKSSFATVSPILEKVKGLKSKHPEILHFISFLKTFSEIVEIQIRMMEDIEKEFLNWNNQEPINLNNTFKASLEQLFKPESLPLRVIPKIPKIKLLKDDLSKKLDEIKQEFIHKLEMFSYRLGVEKGYAPIVDILFFEFNPVNQDRLMKLTGYARSTISTILNMLGRVGFIQKVKIKGERKKYYIPSFPLNMLISVKFAKSLVYMESCKAIFSKTRTMLAELDSKDGASKTFNAFLEDGIAFFELTRRYLLEFLYKFISETNSIKHLEIPYLKERA